jgi:hypothetical protein
MTKGDRFSFPQGSFWETIMGWSFNMRKWNTIISCQLRYIIVSWTSFIIWIKYSYFLLLISILRLTSLLIVFNKVLSYILTSLIQIVCSRAPWSLCSYFAIRCWSSIFTSVSINSISKYLKAHWEFSCFI